MLREASHFGDWLIKERIGQQSGHFLVVLALYEKHLLIFCHTNHN